VIWKAIYDALSSTWRKYGAVAFVDADDEATALALAEAEAHRDYPQSQILMVAIGQSTEAARAAYLAKKAKHAQWLANNRRGVANDAKSI
jgi:hypothetical protein